MPTTAAERKRALDFIHSEEAKFQQVTQYCRVRRYLRFLECLRNDVNAARDIGPLKSLNPPSSPRINMGTPETSIPVSPTSAPKRARKISLPDSVVSAAADFFVKEDMWRAHEMRMLVDQDKYRERKLEMLRQGLEYKRLGLEIKRRLMEMTRKDLEIQRKSETVKLALLLSREKESGVAGWKDAVAKATGMLHW